jgi:hypothetical protein
MLTQAQEERLLLALELLVTTTPETARLVEPATAPPRRARVALITALAAVAAIALPILVINATEATRASTTAASAPRVAPPADFAPVLTSESLGEPAPTARPPGRLLSVATAADAIYAATHAGKDLVVRSDDHGSTWDTVLEADPGDSEGLLGVGERVVLVVEDDDPARDTVEPDSVVTDAPRVLVYDPATGSRSATALPRPEDPEMTGLSLEETNAAGCALGGYQSWVRADGVAVGDRMVVVGHLMLVGAFGDGSVSCGVGPYEGLIWTSDDGGASWQLHDGPVVTTIGWTGDEYVAWSAADQTNVTRDLLVSPDGVAWTQVATTPPVPDGSFLSGASISGTGNRLIATTTIFSWGMPIPDDTIDRQHLGELLGIGEADVDEALDSLGIDLPLDDTEKTILGRHLGFTVPTGAVIAASADGGSTWMVNVSSRAITSAIVVRDGFAALASVEIEAASIAQPPLLVSADGEDWLAVIGLPIARFAPNSIAATSQAIFAQDAETGSLLRIPYRQD